MTTARWGNVCGSRTGAGWYITKPGKNLLAANLTPQDFIFDSTWPKLGSIISGGQRSYVPTGLSTVTTWPTQSAPPLAVVWWRKSTFTANQWSLAISAQGAQQAFTGQQGSTFYINESGLYFEETSTNTATLSVRWRIYDRFTVPSGTQNTPRPRFLLDTTGLYITPPGITAKTAPATQHLIHPDYIAGQVIAAGVGITNSTGIDISFNWSSYSGEYSVYGYVETPDGVFTIATYEERAGNVLRLLVSSAGLTVTWFILR